MSDMEHCGVFESSGYAARLEEALPQLVARLVGAPPGDLGREIDNALVTIGELGEFDRIILADLSGKGKEIIVKHSYTSRDAGESLLRRISETVPALARELQHGEAVASACIPEDGSGNGKTDRGHPPAHDITSMSALSFQVADLFRGALFVASRRAEWLRTDRSVRDLQLLGRIVSAALERKTVAERMDELIRFERLLSEISAAYINLPVDRIEQVIREDLGRLALFLGADWCGLYLADEVTNSFSFTPSYAWFPEEDRELVAAGRARINMREFFESLEYSHEKWRKGEYVLLESVDELPPEAENFKRALLSIGIKSTLSVPISFAGTTKGAVVVSNGRVHCTWRKDLIPRIRLFGEVFINAVARKQSEETVQRAFSEIRKLKDQIEADYVYLKDETDFEPDFDGIFGKSDALKKILTMVEQVAPTNANVLLLGETGTGKGLIARAIHNRSARRARPLIHVNCAALTPNLIESELFGHEKGAFTGALERRAGRFEIAHGTTLFLDEIGELPLELQAKLLRVLQDGEFERVGGSTTIVTDVRVITATNRNLPEEVEAGRFRRDLWYRLSVFPIYIPPLRERLEDIPIFARVFLNKFAKQMGKKFDKIPRSVLAALQDYSWPGNIRELENVIERAVITSAGDSLRIEIFRLPGALPDQRKTLEELERSYIVETLKNSHWKINGSKGAAESLGIHPETLRSRMRKLGIARPEAGK